MATSGTVTFAAGEAAKTLAVPILADARNERNETFTLVLSNASGAYIADGETTGTIVDSDPLQKAWLARFGRAVASHVSDAVEARLGGGRDKQTIPPHVTTITCTLRCCGRRPIDHIGLSTDLSAKSLDVIDNKHGERELQMSCKRRVSRHRRGDARSTAEQVHEVSGNPVWKSGYGQEDRRRVSRHDPMLIGYARVSTYDQTLDLQRDALSEAGCERIFEDTAGGAGERPNLEQALSHLGSGDTLVVWRLDRLGRSLKDLIARAEELRSGGVGLKSLKEAIDTNSATGQLVFHIFGALAEFERALIRERTQAGLQAARARGRQGGRRKRLDRNQWAHAFELYRSRKHTVKHICNLMGISRATLYAYVEEFSKE